MAAAPACAMAVCWKAPWRARKTWAYGEDDLAALAAAYAYGIARNHPFVDGNKRTAAVVSETFLMLNGYALDTRRTLKLVVAFLALAAGELTEDELADWFRQHVTADGFDRKKRDAATLARG